MSNRAFWRRAVFAVCCAALVSVTGCGDDDDLEFVDPTITVPLEGSQQVPPVDTAASGTAVIEIDDLAMTIVVDVEVEDLPAEDILFAHFHAAPPGENGPIVAFIIGTTPEDQTFGAVIGPDDVLPEPERGIETFDDLAEAIRTGDVYVNVHSVEYPAGELRGQTR